MNQQKGGEWPKKLFNDQDLHVTDYAKKSLRE